MAGAIPGRMPAASGLPIRELQLATLVDEVPEGDEWLHEQKFDGYRILAHREGRRVTLLSRRWKDWTAELPTVAEAVAALPAKRAILDGEVAVLMPDGRTSFQALQNAFGRASASIVYFVFDLLALDGEDLRARPLEERKARLADLVAKAPGVIRYSDHVIGGGARFFEAACRSQLEGIVSKRRDQPYLPGRGPTWLKVKCLQRQELVIGGFTEPEGSRTGFGALLVGYYDQGRLVYAGKVGTGYTERMLADLRAKLEPLLQRTSPFDPEPARAWTGPRRHWVRPELVGEVAFSEWTADGRLRHPSFQGLRLDKRPADVVRERPAHTAEASERPAHRATGKRPASSATSSGKRSAPRAASKRAAAVSERAGSPRPGSGAPRSRSASRPGSRAAPRPPARGRRAG